MNLIKFQYTGKNDQAEETTLSEHLRIVKNNRELYEVFVIQMWTLNDKFTTMVKVAN